MKPMSYDYIYNNGERFIPDIIHDLFENIRHKISYQFFFFYIS